MHVIAAKAVAFREALTPEWRAYQQQIVRNAKALADALLARGHRLVTGGTDTHLLLLDLSPQEHHGQGRPGGARPGVDHRQQEHDPVRDEEPDGDERDPHRHAGRDHAGHEGAGDGRRSPRSSTACWRTSAPSAVEARVRGEVQELTNRFPLYPDRREVSGSAPGGEHR